ncbi:MULTISPECIES: ParA family protein [Haloarcula]|uniref:Chromosome partitioning protein ParA n=1 Tax=Haloarcula pellucida TaxID=1427151 RepID=A0A830GNQ9_9EURY|nr:MULTISPECIES: ParA family protein [Halomicroarcula]MBX0350009.1 ParA family protein [Halomicroarcula pellucida]MDS0279756.1 ParA family protein [Halomicroarcula sp. S1AR25-4]GGN95476.1 chromosome partitioning protein ParA [Halomicroarcula pellucida]
MLAFTTYSEAGGVGKSTLAASLAVAAARDGRDVLVIDLDPQEASISYLLDVDDERDDSSADSLVRHLVERPRGEFDDLIRPSEGVDVIPAHNSLSMLGKHLQRREEEANDFGENWNRNVQLLRVLRENDVQDRYDTLIIDPPATADVKLYNAIHATRSLVVPFEPSGKGFKSVDGLEDLVPGLEENLGINVGVLAIVPNNFSGTNDQQDMLEEIQNKGYDVPVVLNERGSLFEGCWRQQCSAFKYIEEHRDRERDYELETLERLRSLSRQLHGTVEATA